METDRTQHRRRVSRSAGPLALGVWLVAAAKLALHLATSARGYGYFGDELYYLACASHLELGYVDHPPASIWLLAGWRGLFGDSLPALRSLPALLGAGSVVLAGALARRAGGRAAAQILTGLVVALAPVNLVVQVYASMNAIDVLLWMGALLLLAHALERETLRWWLALGLVLGIGLLNKLSVAWLGAGLAAGLLVSSRRRVIATPGPWCAAALALCCFAPHVLWQVLHDWPTLTFIRNATGSKMLPVGGLEMLLQQVLVWNPLTAPLWLGGLVWLLRRREDPNATIHATVFLTTAVILWINGTSRPNYLALAVPPLVAAGAVALESWAGRASRRALVPIAGAVVIVGGVFAAPLSLPVLPIPTLIDYSAAIGLGAPRSEHHERSAVDPHFADMLGWPVIVDTVAEVHASLDEAERARAVIVAPSYAEAGALDRFGPAAGLPAVISGHNSYWLWGPGEADGSVAIIAGGARARWQPHWRDLDEVATWDCGHCPPRRNHGRVYVARRPRAHLAEMWPDLRVYD